MLLTLSWVAGCKFRNEGRKLIASADCPCAHRLVFGVIYWYLWTILIPRLRGYHLEEDVDILEDGTSVTKLVKVKNE